MCCCGGLDSEQICKRALVIAIPILIIMVISAGLLGGSVKDLYPTTYGLKVNGNTNTVDKQKIYDGGRYFIGLNQYFIQYSMHQKSIVYSSNYNANKKISNDGSTTTQPQVKIRSKEGLSLRVGVALHYSIATDRQDQNNLKSQLLKTFFNYGTSNYEQFLVNLNYQMHSIGRASIMDACSHFTAQQFYSKRKNLSQAIFDQASKDFKDHAFTLNSALLIQVIVNSEFDSAIQETEIKRQQKGQKEYEKASLQVKLETNKKLAEKDKIINLEKSNSIGYEKKIALESQASVLKIKTDSQKLILDNIKGSILNVDNDQLLTYYWIKMIGNHRAKKLIITQLFDFI